MIYTEYNPLTGELGRQLVCPEEHVQLQLSPGCCCVEGHYSRMEFTVKAGVPVKRAVPLPRPVATPQEMRRTAYPPVAEQLGLLVKALAYLQTQKIDIGPDGKALVAAVQAVKDRFPVPAPIPTPVVPNAKGENK